MRGESRNFEWEAACTFFFFFNRDFVITHGTLKRFPDGTSSALKSTGVECIKVISQEEKEEVKEEI